MSLFTKKFDEINNEDVVSFCEQQIKEGIQVDYKRDFPKNLEKIISAFANTYGGLIVIGISEKDGIPEKPFTGIKYEEKLEDRIWSIIVDNIYPPIFPEIRICPPEQEKTFIVIRVPQSNETPHAIYNKTEVYIRTGNRNKLEDLASMYDIEWLRKRREKAILFRENLYSHAYERLVNICKSREIKLEGVPLTLSFIPVFPRKSLFTIDQLSGIGLKIRTTVNGRDFPQLLSDMQPAQDCMYMFFHDSDNNYFCYTEINSFGLIYHKEDIGWTNKEKEKTLVHQADLLRILEASFEAASKFYNEAGFFGLIQIGINLKELLGVILNPVVPSGYIRFKEVDKKNIAEDKLFESFICSVLELSDKRFRQNNIVDLIKKITWALGQKENEDNIVKMLKEWGRWSEA